MLSAQHFDCHRDVAYIETAYCLKRSVKTLWHAAHQEVKSVNVTTGEEAYNPDPQLTVHPLSPLNKCLYRLYIHPLHIYSICDKNPAYFPPAQTHNQASRVHCGRLRMTDVSQCLGLAVYTFRTEDTHTPMSSNVGEHLLNNDTLWYGFRPRLRICVPRAHSGIVVGRSVRLSVRPSEAWNTLFPPVHESVGPSDQLWPFCSMSVRPDNQPE